MNLIRQAIPEYFIKNGLALCPEGTDEVAWPISMAREILLNVHMAKYAVVGGDIYIKENSKLKFAYETWCCDIEKGEKWEDYITRSNSEAMEFLNSYWIDKDNWFILVVTDKPDAEQLTNSYAR